MEVEEKKNYYPSLPSNYVTLAQLQERWLKERERKQKEEELQQQEQQRKLQQQVQKLQEEREPQPKIHRQVGLGNQRHKTGSWSATGNRYAKQYRPKNSNDWESNRPQTHEKSEGKAEIGPENTDQESKSNRLKKNKRQKPMNRKPRGDKEEGEETTEVAAQTTTAEESETNRPETQEKSEGKAEIGIENADQESKSNRLKKNIIQKRVNRKPTGEKKEGEETVKVAAQTTTVEDSESNRPETHEKSEGKAEIGLENADQESKSNRLKKDIRNKRVNRKPRRDKEGGEETTEVAAQTTTAQDSEDKRGDEKRAIKSEWNDKSNNLTVEVEEKFGALSMNSAIGCHKQNGGSRPPNNGFHRRYPRNYGGRRHGYGDYGGRVRHQEQQKSTGYKRFWVRKDESSNGNVGEIETVTGSYKGSSLQR